MSRGSFNTPRASTTPNTGGNLAPSDTLASDVRNESSTKAARVPPQSTVATPSKLTPLCIDSDFCDVEIRCPLRKALPSMEAVTQGLYQFPVSLCCPRMLEFLSVSRTDTVLREEHFRSALMTLGARKDAIPFDWIQSMLRNVLRKLLSFETSDLSNTNVTVFSPFCALMEIVQRFNREYIDGHRSIIRRIAEKDTQSTALMVLCVTNTSLQERPGPHQSTIEVTDGWYFARCNLDLPLSQFVQDGLIAVGDKLMVWGAASCRDDACGPLELLNSQGALLSLLFNGTKKAAYHAPLGAQPPNTAMPVSINQIHANGGPVPCISGVVTRVLPKFYIDRAPRPGILDTTPARGSNGAAGGKVIRNAIAESKFCGSFEARREIAYEQAVTQGMSSDAAAVLMRDQFARDVSEVTTIILETGEPGEVVAIQRTTRCGGTPSHDLEESSLPREGQRIHIFGVVPSKATNAPPPLSVKLLYVRSQFMFVVDRNQPLLAPDHREERSSSSFCFNVVVQSSLSSFSSMKFGQMVDVIVVCVGSQTQPTANGETAFFFCGVERNVFGVLVARSFPGARELELAQPTPGTACLVRNATFSCYDESKEYNVLRLHANEYTIVSTRTMSMELQQRMKELENKRSEWKPTFDLGKQLLVDSNTSSSNFVKDALGGSSANRSSVSVHEVAAYGGIEEYHGEVQRAVSAPYYLRNQAQLPRREATPVNYSSGVKLTTVSESPAASSIMRPLFESSSAKSTSPLERKLNSSDQTDVASSLVGSPPLHELARRRAESATAALSAMSRHVFGNITVESFSLHFDGEHCIDLHTSMGCTLASITHQFSQHNTQWSCKGIELSFPSHLGRLTILLNPTFIAALGDHMSLTPQQLSALSSDDSVSHFSVSRSSVLSTATSLIDAWEMLFCRSVVVPPAVLAVIAPPLSMDQENIDGSVVAALVQCDKDDGICRWNRVLVPDALEILWWTEQEWQQLKAELQEALSSKLFKISLGLDGRSVEKMFFLKDNCTIAELMAE
ncbi:BRCA2-like protein, putative [Bodo saltans]|uniref:BRCA2-like protein, putative n=1 Tax=Bodo saltans TaxID=75058 RepID=A0A0S4IMI8_BODSA|nr:BRCA2-like protein, putative [Bodo saltans]|eukprot:CUE72332.1 BRCA2-like protein, putative [Bodo saltans]